MWSGCEGFGVMWGFGLIHMLLIWAVVIGGFVWIARTIGRHRHVASDSALELLRRRYAAGEVDREEFNARRRDLEA